VTTTFRLATSPLAPLLGHLPVRGPARLLHRSYTSGTIPLPRGEQVLTTAHGDRFRVSLASFLEWQLWAFGSFESYVAEVLRYLIRPGDRCVDVGANVGLHTVRMAKLAGPGGEVIAIEPDPGLARRARDNVALNQLDNVRVLALAASDRDGDRVALYRAQAQDPNHARASLLPHAYLGGPSAEVETVTIDQACPGPVALIKIDVEGHEAAVVAGARRVIAEHAPAIVFEYAPELLTGPEQCPFDQLAAAGYRMLRISWRRHPVTGRGTLALIPLPALPELGGDLLALPGHAVRRVAHLVRSP
jgi:FkbM family methyltransferase